MSHVGVSNKERELSFTMAAERNTYLFIILIIMPKGLSQIVETQRVVTVTLGDDAYFSCRLNKPKDVMQVTWQKESPERNVNVATYNERFGVKVNSPFQEKMEFLKVGLQNCSIVYRGVLREDESCYRCLFNTYPGGAVSGRTCLQVNELYGPTLLVTQTNDSHTLSSEVTVSCSATGRPAPIVTWEDSKHLLENSSTVKVNNPNETVTVTISSTMAVPSIDTVVGCVVSSGEIIKLVSKEIPAKSAESSKSASVTGIVAVGLCSAGVIVLVCVMIWWQLKGRNKKNRETKGQDVLEIVGIHSLRTPIKQQENYNGSVRIPGKQTTEQEDAELRSLTTQTPVRHLEEESGSVRTPCFSGVVEEGRVRNEGGSTTRKRKKNRFFPRHNPCNKQLFT
ncbi:hypothetical protein DPEC_G00154060 [Dallia pectoralis]|uniref:Uncharacterized protein n=1 Tax=Dallia pectoralis TaxID=75939 RepID=A0ACC2GKA7_DALPE|nr:hypothetical protein DPEC_G00154060 [Dallia pectoralis]